MIRFAGFLVALLSAGTAVASDFELRIFRVDIPVAEDVQNIISQHFGQPLDVLQYELDQAQDGLQLLATLDPSDWDGGDLTNYPQVNGGPSPIQMSEDANLFSGEAIPFEYLERRADGRFASKTAFVEQGLRLNLKRMGPSQTRVRANVALPGPRLPVEGVSLDVGPPTQGEGSVWTNLVMNTQLNKWSLALFSMQVGGESPPVLLLLFLRDLGGSATPQPAQTEEKLIAPIQFSIEAAFLRVPSDPTFKDRLIPDANAEPIAGKGQRITAIRLPESDVPVPVSDLGWERFKAACGKEGLELLSAPRVTTMAGLKDRENPSDALFKIVLPKGPNPLGRTLGKDGFGGGESGGGSFGGGRGAATPKRDLVSLFDDVSPLVGEIMRSKEPGKPAVISDVMTQKTQVADEDGIPLDADEIYTGISVALKIACNSAGEDIVLDIALVETYLDRPPAIKLTRKGSPARPTPVEYSVPDETTLPRRIERSCRFRQPVENGETLAYLLRDDVRDDLTLVFVTVQRVEGEAAFFRTAE